MKILIGILLVSIVATKSVDKLIDFKKKIFNFNYPAEGLYEITNIAKNQPDYMQILGYGDFNNDLWTDFAAKTGQNNSIGIFLWNDDESVFEQIDQIEGGECSLTSILIYDADLNGFLDITGWGTVNSQNCLIPFLQNDNKFTPLHLHIFPQTSQPFVISFGDDNGNTKTNALCIFQKSVRKLLVIDPSESQSYIEVGWEKVFESTKDFSTIPFAHPHWNSFLDLTGDCRSDVVIVDENHNIEIWVNYGSSFQYSKSLDSSVHLTSLFFTDMDYSGSPDLIYSTKERLTVKHNKKKLYDSSQFCCANCYSVEFEEQSMEVQVEGFSIKQAPSHVADVDIDGYPDVMLILTNQTHQTVRLYMNGKGNQFVTNDNYNLDFVTTDKILSVSFFDLLENGYISQYFRILDFILCIKKQNQVSTKAYINNYLQQNFFYIKGYGASGENSSQGCQIVGANFLWVNSLGQNILTAYQAQITQTSYNALQLPYAYCGLGRANNYVQSFTMGVLGNSNHWSPIIPNSQLVVYGSDEKIDEWKIRVFILPTDALIYVTITSIVLLGILGIILIVLKCKQYKKQEQPLMQFLH